MHNKKEKKLSKKKAVMLDSGKGVSKTEGARSLGGSGADAKKEKTEKKETKGQETRNKTLVTDFRVSDATVRALKKDNITSLFPIQVCG